MTAGPIAEESELLFFNTVFHLTSSTVNLVVDHLGSPDQISDHKARVGSFGSVLGFGNNASLFIPTTGPILKPFEESDFLAAFRCLRSARCPSLALRALSRSFLAMPTM